MKCPKCDLDLSKFRNKNNIAFETENIEKYGMCGLCMNKYGVKR